jgi:beta-mannosidase
MDLSGSWRAAPAREELRRTFHEPALDDRSWAEVAVPGPWMADDGLAEERSVLYRHRFEMEPVTEGRRRWLRLDGLAQQGDVWLNGAYVGNTDGYFVPHQFEVTHLMGPDRSQSEASHQHLIALDITAPTFGDPDERTNLMGAILDPELSGASGHNPGGIWQGVSLHDTGMAAIRHFRVTCIEAGEVRARLALRCVFDHPDGGPVVLRTRVAGVDHELCHPAAHGENRVEWTIDIPDPERWWPHRLGDQPLHPLSCALVVDDVVQDQRSCHTAFREVKMQNWHLLVNNVRIFAKGVVMLPQPGDASIRQVRADVEAAKALGFDMIRLVAHVAHPEVYDAADELGMLIWQEMPLRGVMARSVRGQAVRQAREMVDHLSHHPSVAVWCAHDEPFRRPVNPPVTPPVIGQQRPSWNRAVLDTSVRRVLQRTDGSRPIVIHTAVPPHLPQLDGTTSHLWFGWHDSRAADLGAAIARTPRMGRFVTAFGAATVDPDLPELRSAHWPALDWGRIGKAIGAPTSSLHHLVSPEPGSDGATWARSGQAAQAELLRITIETLRRLKYQPTGGFCAFYLADPSPAGGFGILDHDRRAKPAWRAVEAACAPVIAVADPFPTGLASGAHLEVAIHVVSDLHDPLIDARLTSTVQHPDGSTETHRHGGTVGADTVEYISTLSIIVRGTGDLALTLDLTANSANGPVTAQNRYHATVL